MRIKGKAAGVAVVAALVIGVFAVNASAASALTWNQPNNTSVKETGTLTFTLAGGSPKTCAEATITGLETKSGQMLSGAFPTTVTCADGSSYQLYYEGIAMSTTSMLIAQQQFIGLKSAYGGYLTARSYYGTWANGNATTPSKLTFSNVLIGNLSPSKQEIRMSGTLNVTTASGGLLKLE